jgi:hypothetical protein
MRLRLEDCVVAAVGDTESDHGRVGDSSWARLDRSYDHLGTRPAGAERHVEVRSLVGRMKGEDRNIEDGAVAGRRKAIGSGKLAHENASGNGATRPSYWPGKGFQTQKSIKRE